MSDRLGVYLWRSSFTEHIAASVFFKLARWEFLDPADRRLAQQFAEQEVNHAEMLRALGKEFIATRPDGQLRPLDVPSDPWTALSGVSQAERLSIAGFVHMIELGVRLRHPGIVAAYGQIIAEELPHLAWGRRVMREIRQDKQMAADVRRYLATHPIAAEYRLVAKERPWLGAIVQNVHGDRIRREGRTEGDDLGSGFTAPPQQHVTIGDGQRRHGQQAQSEDGVHRLSSAPRTTALP